MIADLKPYPAMKDSGVPWLGEVPEHWEVRRIKRLFREVDVRSVTGTEPLLSLRLVQGLVDHLGAGGRAIPPDSLEGFKKVAPGEMVMNRMRASMGLFGVATTSGLVSPDYAIFRPSPRTNGDYFLHLFKTPRMGGVFRAESKGLGTGESGFLRLYSDRFGVVAVPFPPRAEQSAIVRFLDHADRRIGRYVRAKQKLIVLLNEQKQAIIHCAVTRGLDPNVRLKPSGVEWLGDVPEHWEEVRLKQVAAIQTGITLGKHYGDAPLVERPYLRVANVQTGRLSLSRITTVRVPPSEAAGSTLQPGDVLMTEGGDIDKLGRGCVWRGEIRACLHQNHIFAVRPRPRALLPQFLVALMGSPHGRSYFQTTAKQTTNLAATNSTTLGNLPLLLPGLDEQQRILDGFADEVVPLDAAMARAAREIVLLREYRTRLIADVVTGKLDVREAAVRLPDEAEQPAVPEADALTDADDDAADDLDAVSEETEA